MSIIKVSDQEQITLPADVRQQLELTAGDALVFEVVAANEARIKVIRQHRLSDLYGSLPATRPFPGKEETRTAVGTRLGDKLQDVES